jgi:hypothetical protein
MHARAHAHTHRSASVDYLVHISYSYERAEFAAKHEIVTQVQQRAASTEHSLQPLPMLHAPRNT